MTDRDHRSRIYFDANIFIYAVEGEGALAERLNELFKALRARPGSAVTSELTLAEVLVKATAPQRREYLSLIVWSGIFEVCAVSRDILIETAAYRKISEVSKLADAIHVVTAIRHDCDTVLSADLRLKVPNDMVVIDPTPDHLSSLMRDLH